jgi:hypothetical protein
MFIVTYPCEVLSQWDEEGHRAKDLLGLHLRGEHHEFTQLHHAFNLKQKKGQCHKIVTPSWMMRRTERRIS